jgi:hypothetical protein
MDRKARETWFPEGGVNCANPIIRGDFSIIKTNQQNDNKNE